VKIVQSTNKNVVSKSEKCAPGVHAEYVAKVN
jgi:hypothetical protein